MEIGENTEYRLGRQEDLDAVCELIQKAIAEMDRQGIHQWDEIYPARCDFEKDIKNETLYLAFVKDKLAALYVISSECDEQYRRGRWEGEDETACVLHRFCVSPEYQNKGIGRTVLRHIEEQTRKMGYESLRLDTFTENPFAQKLYLHNGYEPRGQATWRKGIFDLMEKRFSGAAGVTSEL